MRRQDIIENIKVRFGEYVVDFVDKSKNRVYFTLKKEGMFKLTKYLFNDIRARFSTASGVDTRKNVEILYHFSVDSIGLVLTFRVVLDKKDLEIDSLASIMKSAEWIERELHEMLGINFKGNDNLKHLLLKDDWPKGNYPLRRDSKK